MLQPLRWLKGRSWSNRFQSEDWSRGEQVSDSPSLINLYKSGFIEIGQWGQEKFYRLSERSTRLLGKKTTDFEKFYLTPNLRLLLPQVFRKS